MPSRPLPARRPRAVDIVVVDLRQLRYFTAIVEQGSFSRAATVLHVAQPALSLHVQNMEADLGTPLLFRTSRGVEPTEAGSILLRHARIILGQLTVAEEEIRGHQNDPKGEVRLGVPGTIGQILAVPLIRAVHRHHPGIRVRIAEAMSGFILEWMREERVDLAILYGSADDNGIRTERLLDESLHFFGSADAPQSDGLPPPGAAVALHRIAALPLIIPGAGHGLRTVLDEAAVTAGVALNAVIDVDSYGNIKALVEEGLGYSVLPMNAIAAEIAEGRLIGWTIEKPEMFRSIHLAHSAKRPMTNAVSAVLKIARGVILDLSRSGQWVGARAVDDDPGA